MSDPIKSDEQVIAEATKAVADAGLIPGSIDDAPFSKKKQLERATKKKTRNPKAEAQAALRKRNTNGSAKAGQKGTTVSKKSSTTPRTTAQIEKDRDAAKSALARKTAPKKAAPKKATAKSAPASKPTAKKAPASKPRFATKVVKATKDEVAAFVKRFERKPEADRVECTACGKRLWATPVGLRTHGLVH